VCSFLVLALPADSTLRARPLVLIEVDKPRYGLDSATIQQVADSVPEAEVVAVRRAEISRRIGGADAFVGNLTPDQVHAATRLRWLQVPSGGVEDYGFPEIRDRPIVVTNSKIIHGPAMADHAMAMLLALTRRLHLIIPDRARSRWKPTRYSPIPGKCHFSPRTWLAPQTTCSSTGAPSTRQTSGGSPRAFRCSTWWTRRRGTSAYSHSIVAGGLELTS
jgi:hypothetical protein